MFTPATPPVLILGSHRSGTSAITERLAAMGLFVGARLDSHAESAFFQRLNRRLTSEAGGHWTTPRIVRDALDDIADLAAFAEPLRSHIMGPEAVEYWGLRRGVGSSDVRWGWKDPRNTYLAPLWAALFADVRIISMQRDPRACALSLYQRTTEQTERIAAEATAEGSRVWNRGQMRSLRGRPVLTDGWRTTTFAGALDVALEYREIQVGLDERHPNVLSVDYEQFVDDPEGVLATASQFCALSATAQMIRSQAASISSSINTERAHEVDVTAGQRLRLGRLGYIRDKGNRVVPDPA